MRVSLDIYGFDNKNVRLYNKEITNDRNASFNGAIKTIERCIKEGINLTVQTVISSYNDQYTYLVDLRDFLVSKGVKNWVFHIAVEAGKARIIQEKMRKESNRRGGILPKPSVVNDLRRLIKDTIKNNIPIDVRLTNTNSIPNSVILISSKGDIFTEGPYKNGKNLLHTGIKTNSTFNKKIWPSIDNMGHLQRYINWNLAEISNLSVKDAFYPIPLPNKH